MRIVFLVISLSSENTHFDLVSNPCEVGELLKLDRRVNEVPVERDVGVTRSNALYMGETRIKDVLDVNDDLGPVQFRECARPQLPAQLFAAHDGKAQPW